MTADLFKQDKLKIAASFNHAAHSYEQHAVLQKEVGQRLQHNLDIVKLKPRRVLNIGSGTGLCAQGLEKRFRGAHIFCLDLAQDMLRIGQSKQGWWFPRQHFICADMDALPIKDASVDLIFSNLTFQWSPDLLIALLECFRVLKPGGLLFFSTLGPDTLKELRASWQQVDQFDHVNHFKDMHDIGDLLMHTRFIDPVIDREDLVLTYDHAEKLMQDLKLTGTQTVLGKRPQGLQPVKKLHAMYQAYEQFRDKAGKLPATYEVIYGHAVKPELARVKAPPKREPVYIPVGAITRSSV